MGLFDKIELPGVKKVVVIASGKGGVGKSMVAANLAVAMARQGKKSPWWMRTSMAHPFPGCSGWKMQNRM
jgi:RecA-family ATPase